MGYGLGYAYQHESIIQVVVKKVNKIGPFVAFSGFMPVYFHSYSMRRVVNLLASNSSSLQARCPLSCADLIFSQAIGPGNEAVLNYRMHRHI